MPTTTINNYQREGLYELVRHHLYSIDDLWAAFGRSRNYATAERLADAANQLGQLDQPPIAISRVASCA